MIPIQFQRAARNELLPWESFEPEESTYDRRRRFPQQAQNFTRKTKSREEEGTVIRSFGIEEQNLHKNIST
ncbi:unnamed protein product, partial [Musa banksii]